MTQRPSYELFKMASVVQSANIALEARPDSLCHEWAAMGDDRLPRHWSDPDATSWCVMGHWQRHGANHLLAALSALFQDCWPESGGIVAYNTEHSTTEVLQRLRQFQHYLTNQAIAATQDEREEKFPRNLNPEEHY